MPKFYPVVLALLGCSLAATAQDYRPFRAGLTYQLSESATPGDTTHTLRLLGAGTLVGADSVFQFAPMAQRLPTARVVGNCYGSHMVRSNNLFGATLTRRAAGGFVLTAQNGRTLVLQPRAALGLVWPAGPAGLTAQVLARRSTLVLGQPDSVATISFSNGQQLELSKRFGFVQGAALINWLDARYPARALALTALPEAGLGTYALSAKKIFDFQPQDVFLRHYTSVGTQTGSMCSESWTRDSVLTRSTDPNGDLVYTMQQQVLMRSYGSPGAPTGFCSGSGSTMLQPATTVTLRVSDQGTSTYTTALTSSFMPQAGAVVFAGQLRSPAYRSASYNNALEQTSKWMGVCQPVAADSTFLTAMVDFAWTSRFTHGLGETYRNQFSISYDEVTELIGYRKNGVTYGQLRTLAQLPTAVARPAASTAAFPNPFQDELTVRFELPRPQAVALELRDALGRVVLAQPAQLVAAGAAQLQLATPALPAGVYTLWLRPEGSPVQVLKVSRIP